MEQNKVHKELKRILRPILIILTFVKPKNNSTHRILYAKETCKMHAFLFKKM